MGDAPELRAMIGRTDPDGTLTVRVIWKRDFEDNWSPYGWILIGTDPQDEVELVRWYLEQNP